jgi:5'-nucleotidase
VRRHAVAGAALTALLAVAGCGGDDDEPSPDGARSTTTQPAVLDVLVTNDDGYEAPGIDALVGALRARSDLHVDVVAPAANSSGTGGRTTPGEVVTREVRTASGYEATAVEGYPADAVAVALDELALEPDVVVSGVNTGQNLGRLTEISGTVGAARAAAAAGVPALAVSAGLAPAPDYDTAVEEALAWLADHRAALLAGEAPAAATNLNVPTCADGDVRDTVEVPLATEPGEEALASDAVRCSSTLTDPPDDVDAFNNGFATLTELPAA